MCSFFLFSSQCIPIPVSHRAAYATQSFTEICSAAQCIPFSSFHRAQWSLLAPHHSHATFTASYIYLSEQEAPD